MRDNAKGGALTEVTFFILLSLYTPKHGYAVMQFIEDSTKGRLTLGAGTLYGALNSLQEKAGLRLLEIVRDEKRISHYNTRKRNCRKGTDKAQ